MHLRTLHSVKQLHKKTVLLRVDLNVAISNTSLRDVKGQRLLETRVDPTEDFRIRAVVPTIEYLLKRGARVVLLAHLGRPDGKVVAQFRLEPVARRLQQLLYTKLEIRDSRLENPINLQYPISNIQLRRLLPPYEVVPNRVWLLENLRFDSGEEKNDPKFAKALASLGDLYVNDAFAVSHRKNASVHAITKFLPSYAGLLMEKEVATLSSVWDRPRRSRARLRRALVVIMGGAKISTKIGLIKKFLPHADHVLLGGALANTLLKVQGYQVGKSLVDDSVIPDVQVLHLTDTRLSIPVDVIVARSRKARSRVAAAAGVKKDEWIYDIGPDTVDLFSRAVRTARMIVWNGPLGLFEEPKYAKSTYEVLRAVLANKKAKVIIGGGETITAFQQYVRKSHVKCPADATNFAEASSVKKALAGRQMSNVFTSTGGGAMLEFLEKGMLPGVERLMIYR